MSQRLNRSNFIIEMSAPNILLPYQKKWLKDKAQVKVAVKSRRVGITWATATEAITRALSGDDDTYYVAQELRQATQFIRDCSGWIKHFGIQSQAGKPEQYILTPDGQQVSTTAVEKDGIQAQRILFKSGKAIYALSSSPSALRGKQGLVILDEYAHIENADEVLTAAMALTMWGSQVMIISTHYGSRNPFAKLVKDVEAGKLPYSLHTITLRDAVQQGLYRQICRVNGRPWTQRAETDWIAQTYAFYGPRATEELDCIPASGSAGSHFKSNTFPLITTVTKPIKRTIRAWDFAATTPSLSNPDPDWTRGVLIHQHTDDTYTIADLVSLRAGPAKVTELLQATAAADGYDVEIVLQQDPGAAGVADLEHKQRLLRGYAVTTIRPSKSKELYAGVWSPMAARGEIAILDNHWTDDVLDELESFPAKGSHDDIIDPISMAMQAFLVPQWDGQGYEGGTDHRHPTDRAMNRNTVNLFDDDDDAPSSRLGEGFF